MTGLSKPEGRRALRSVIQAIIALALTGLLYWLTHLLRGNAEELMGIARGALLIIGLGTLFYGAENVTRAIKLTVLGNSAEFGEQPRGE